MGLVAIVDDDEHVREAVKDVLDYGGFATMSMVTQDGYEKAVRQAAQEGAGDKCVSRRWELGWTSYLRAAVAHDGERGATR